MSTPSIRMAFETIRSLAFGSISGTFAAVGTPTTHPAREIWITNGTDAPMIFTTNIGNNPNGEFILLAGASWINDNNANRIDSAEGFWLASGTQLYVKQVSAPTSGSVYFTVIYGA